jgi:Protein of unknown function (DUF2950)
MTKHRLTRAIPVALMCAALAAQACSRPAPPASKTFATPEDAVKALIAAAKDKKLDEVVAIFGRDGQSLVDSSDAATARRNRDVFVAAAAERWRLEERGAGARMLLIGNEDWPFPVPLVKDGDGWRFDTAAGREEILARRIGRNELAVIQICHTYVNAQHLYAARGHDGQPAGLYATAFRSDPGKQNGLYWAAARHEKRSPLGDLVAQAASEGRSLGTGTGAPAPFHGYFFRILPAKGGFGLIAWRAEYDATGVMTFLVNQDGVVREKDLGPDTAAAAQKITAFEPDASWTDAEAPGK